MKKALIIIISIVVVLVAVAAVFFVYKNTRPDIMSEEQIYKEIAEKVENFTYDEKTGLLYVNNEIVVMASEGASARNIKALAEEYDAVIGDSMEDAGIYCFSFEKEMDSKKIEKLCKSLKKESIVDDAFLNPVVAQNTDGLITTEAKEKVSAPEGESDEKKSDKKSDKESDEKIEKKPVYPKDSWDNASWDEDVPGGNNWGVEAIKAPSAWAYLDELYDVNVGLIDALPTTEHKDLDIRVFLAETDAKSNYYSFSEYVVEPSSAEFHGCHVAGIIGATWENDKKGVAGVLGDKGHMYYCNVSTISEEYDGYVTEFCSAYDYIKEIKELVNKDVRAINISLTTGRTICYAASKGNKNARSYIEKQANMAEKMLKRIIGDIKDNGGNDFVICIAAGNTNGRVYVEDDKCVYGYREIDPKDRILLGGQRGGVLTEYSHFLSFIEDPDIKDRIIVVGSVGIDKKHSTTKETRYKYSDFSCLGPRVDVVAPGEEIYSLSQTDYDFAGGTSMATPHVTGVAGLAFAANPELTGPEVKTLICTQTNGRYYFDGGQAGLVDASKVTRIALASRKGERLPMVSNKVGLDLCFVVDTTASMGDDIYNAKENMVDILSKLSEKSADYRVALVDYRDFSDRAGVDDYPAKIQLDFSSDDEEIIAAINGLTLGDGGDWDETVYSALHEALSLNWRSRSRKVIIILGDAQPLDPEPYTGYTYDDVILALYNADIGIDLESSDSRVLGEPDASAISVYTIGIDTEGYDFFDDVASDTGGAYMDIESADEVSDAIMETIEDIEIEENEVTVKFGKEMSNETVDIYKKDEYLFSFPLSDSGSFTLQNIEEGKYEWRVDRLGKSGTVSISEDDEDAKIKGKQSEWYSFALVIWYRYRTEFILISAGAVILLVAVIVLVNVIKKKIRKRKERKAAVLSVQQTAHQTIQAQPVIQAEQPMPQAEQPVPQAEQLAPQVEQPTPQAEQPAPQADTQVKCPVCGAVVQKGYRFCTVCGTPIAAKE